MITKAELVFEGIFEDNLANGWKAGQFRIVPQNGGFALEELKAMMNGKPEWKREYFSRDRKAVEAALARRIG